MVYKDKNINCREKKVRRFTFDLSCGSNIYIFLTRRIKARITNAALQDGQALLAMKPQHHHRCGSGCGPMPSNSLVKNHVQRGSIKWSTPDSKDKSMFKREIEESCSTLKQKNTTMITLNNRKNTFSMLTCQKENWKIFRLRNKIKIKPSGFTNK